MFDNDMLSRFGIDNPCNRQKGRRRKTDGQSCDIHRALQQSCTVQICFLMTFQKNKGSPLVNGSDGSD